MKKTVKILLLISLFLFLAGVFISGLSVALSGFDFMKASNQAEMHKKTYSFEIDSLSKINFQAVNGEIELRPSDDSKIHFELWENEKEYYTILNEDGQLSIKHTNDRKWYEHFIFNFDFSSKTVVISVPADMKAEFGLNTSNGAILVKDLNLCAGFSVSTSNGAIRLSNVGSEESISLKTSNGLILLDKVSCPQLNAKTSNGIIKTDMISVLSGSFETSNGAIKGTIQGDKSEYNITSKTSLGSNNLPESQTVNGSSKYLSFKTSNGEINVEFKKT